MEVPLKVIKSKLKEISNLLTYQATLTPNGTQYQISGLNNIRKIVRILKEINIFTVHANYLLNSAIFTTSSDNQNINLQEGNQIKITLDTLSILIENLNLIFDSIVPLEDPTSLNIKLPDSINDFDELSKITKEIDIAISRPLLISDLNCKTKISSVENGSIWLNVDFSSVTTLAMSALVLVSALLTAAIKNRKDWWEGSKFKEEFKALHDKNNKVGNLTEVNDTKDAEVKALLLKKAEEIQSEFFKEAIDKNVTINEIKNSIETLTELIKKGAIFTPSITATEETINFFPTKSEILGIESKTKEIESPKDN
ncbi:MAG TPA: hypothetical protein VN026_17135 [Bacteroidia bacterium]|jgi:hypothetical protein|nr:hypothetical protein [Bacteroidia bacterium]